VQSRHDSSYRASRHSMSCAHSITSTGTSRWSYTKDIVSITHHAQAEVQNHWSIALLRDVALQYYAFLCVTIRPPEHQPSSRHSRCLKPTDSHRDHVDRVSRCKSKCCDIQTCAECAENAKNKTPLTRVRMLGGVQPTPNINVLDMEVLG